MTISDRVRVKNVERPLRRHYLLKKPTFEYRRANGEWQTQTRETYDRGNCRDPAAVQSRAAAPWCWCGSSAIRPMSTATTIS